MLTSKTFLDKVLIQFPEIKNGVLVAISGGADSVCLLHLLHTCGIPLQAAHINYQLRGEESNKDVEYVKLLCAQLGVKLYIAKTNKKELMELSSNTQDAARIFRYQFFNQTAVEHDIPYIATAHHATDQAETILYNIIKGKTWQGVSGMMHKNRNIIRPLLPYTRSEIEQYLNNQRIDYRTDGSNLQDFYQRNFIRNNIIPQLEKIDPKVSAHINQLGDNVQVLGYAFAQLAQQCAAQMWIEKLEDNLVQINLNNFEHPKEVLPYILYDWLKDYGFNFQQCKQLATDEDMQSGKVLLSNSHQLVKYNRVWHLVSIVPTQTACEGEIIDWPATIICGSQHYEAEKMTWNNQCDPKSFDGWLIAYNEGDTIQMGIIETGDLFKPLGMSGSKKVSDYLIDRKVPLHQKPNIRKITINGEIAAIIPLGISNTNKITFSTKQIIQIKRKL